MISQGDIFAANLNPVSGHEQAGHRPVIVLQNNILNKNLNTVIVAPVTTNMRARGKMTTYFLPKNVSGLTEDSIALLFQIRTLDKKRLQERLGSIEIKSFYKLRDQLKFIF